MTRISPPGLALFFIAVLVLSGCGLGRPRLIAKKIDHVPDPNRLIEVNSIWKDARPLIVRVRNPINPGSVSAVSLQAVHDGGWLSVLARWPDTTEATEISRAWVWSAPSTQYYLRELPTDMFAMKFALSGAQQACMMTGEEGVYDVWQWKSGWNRVYGFADDRKLVISRTESQLPGFTRSFPLAPGEPPIFLTWIEDAGDPPYQMRGRPRSRGNLNEFGIVARPPSGSRADILAEGIYQESGYFLELKRALNTGFEDDYTFEGKGPHPFAIAVTDNDEGQAHYTSELIDLYLE